jgi:hypothetical protein
VSTYIRTCIPCKTPLTLCYKYADPAYTRKAALGVYSRPFSPQAMHLRVAFQSICVCVCMYVGMCSEYGSSADLSVGKCTQCCSRALDWVCLPVRWSGTGSHASMHCTCVLCLHGRCASSGVCLLTPLFRQLEIKALACGT